MSSNVKTFDGPATAEPVMLGGNFVIEPGSEGTAYSQMILIAGTGFAADEPQQIGIKLEIPGVPEIVATVETVETQMHVAYTPAYERLNLDPGNYTFTIQSVNANSVWDSDDTIFMMVIEMEHSGTGTGKTGPVGL